MFFMLILSRTYSVRLSSLHAPPGFEPNLTWRDLLLDSLRRVVDLAFSISSSFWTAYLYHFYKDVKLLKVDLLLTTCVCLVQMSPMHF